MAGGYHHDQLTSHLALPLGVLTAGTVFSFTGDIIYAGQTGGLIYLGCQIQRIMTPDRDQENKNYDYWLSKMLDPYFARLWEFMWWFYGKAIPHRHWLSHGYVISTFVRLTYVFLMVSWLVMFDWYYKFWQTAFYYWDYTGFFLLGIIIADCGHLFLDFVPSARRLVEKIWTK